jgi:hypothetical protein
VKPKVIFAILATSAFGAFPPARRATRALVTAMKGALTNKLRAQLFSVSNATARPGYRER